MVSSQTGSGKTAAFLLPVLHTLIRQQAERAAAERAEEAKPAAQVFLTAPEVDVDADADLGRDDHIDDLEENEYIDEDGETHSVDSSDVNDYLRGIAGADLSAKVFRTWTGSVEAMAGLAGSEVDEVLDVLFKLNAEGITVIMIEHNLHAVMSLADRVVVMSSRPGRIVADVVVPLSRPRSIRELQTNEDFHRTYAQVWKHLEEGWVHHEG